MKKKKVPLLLALMGGAIGKKYVVKHYRDAVVVTRFPDMSGIVATIHQRKCRNLFKEAVAWAKQVMADPLAKQAYQKKLQPKDRLFNRLVKEYILAAREGMAGKR